MGWYIVTVATVVWSAYIIVGIAVTVYLEGVWAYPNRVFWTTFKGYMKDGAAVLLRQPLSKRE